MQPSNVYQTLSAWKKGPYSLNSIFYFLKPLVWTGWVAVLLQLSFVVVQITADLRYSHMDV